MNIFILGGGRVGYHLALLLSEEVYEVTVIENDPERQEYIDQMLNAQVILGDGSSALFLQSLDVGEADLFVACTGHDETNLLAAAAAKGLGARQAVARVEKAPYMVESYMYDQLLNIDYILSPDALVAQEISNYILHPGVLVSEEFSHGHILLRQVQVSPDAPAAGHLLSEILTPGSGTLVGVIERQGKVFVPDGTTRILSGDKATLLSKREKLSDALSKFQGRVSAIQRVAIMGAGTIGLWIAHTLESTVAEVKLFERNSSRALAVAGEFRKRNIQVINRDATTRDSMEQEHLETFDLFIATTEDDERNIVAGVLAREVGVSRVAAVIHHPDFAPLAEKLGVTLAVTPRSVVANSVLKIVRQKTIAASTTLNEGEAEILEISISATSPLKNLLLKDSKGKLPPGVLIATVMRGNEAFIPDGTTMIQEDDSLVLIATTENIHEIQKLFHR
ncbi:MAG TPA: Trk system potassium transporter TrkA [Candidatus Hydrogenedentes bacterium]|nr:Trk system potassium transporter TrkA [Candidatus Hydrogenedentota bacterium]